MTYIFVGVLIGVIIYFYFLVQNLDKKTPGIQQNNSKRSGAPILDYQALNTAEGKRHCPICRHPMDLYDMLYAEIYKGEPRDKVFIHGCKYCYKSPAAKTEESAETKDSIQSEQNKDKLLKQPVRI